MTILSYFSRCFGRGEVIVFASTAAAAARPDPQGYSFVEFSVADLAAPGLFQEKDRPRFFPMRLAEGYRCFGWRSDVDGSVAGYMWFAPPTSPPAPWMIGLKLQLDPRHAYVWDCRTSPVHEGMGLYSAGLLQLAMAAKSEKVDTVLIDSNPANARSLAAIERAGFRHEGVASARRLGAAYLVRWRGTRHFVRNVFNSGALVAALETREPSA